MTQAETAQATFDTELAAATTEAQVFDALYTLSNTLIPVRLWTVMTVDMEAGVARRAYTNMPEAYPASGTKPITRNAWFDVVHGRHECFVANTLDDIAKVFPDYELIGSLGCGSVLNLPVVDDGTLLATVNLLDAEEHFTDARLAEYRAVLAEPALRAVRKARALQQG
jgi:hypothetical protein